MLARERLEAIARRHGLELVGVTDAAALPEDRIRMEASVAAGRMGDMGWMAGSRSETATDPRRLEPDARSVVVVAAPYAGSDRRSWDPIPDALHRALAPVLESEPRRPAGRIARYAVGGDYHITLRRRLEALAAEMRADGLPAGATAYVDTVRSPNGPWPRGQGWAGSARTRT